MALEMSGRFKVAEDGKQIQCRDCGIVRDTMSKMEYHYRKEHGKKGKKGKNRKPKKRTAFRPEDRRLEEQVSVRFNFCPHCSHPLPKKVVY